MVALNKSVATNQGLITIVKSKKEGMEVFLIILQEGIEGGRIVGTFMSEDIARTTAQRMINALGESTYQPF